MLKSVAQILKAQSKKSIPTGVGRITTQGVMSRRDRFLRIFGGLKTESGATNTKFEQVTEEDLQNLPIVDLVVKLVKSDTLLDMTVDLYCTLVSLEHTLTSEQDRTQRGIDEINQMLTDKKIPLPLLVSHIVSSMILRGNVCVERVFDEKGRPSSVFAIDTRWFEWRLHDTPIDGQMWFLGQFTGEQNTWERLAETPHVMWLSVNPLVGERTGRSPLASAFDPLIKDTRMLDDLSEVISTQAFIRRYIQFKVIEMKNAGYSDSKIAELVKEAQDDMSAWSNLKPDEIPTSTDAIDWNSEPGVSQGSGMGFVDTVDRVYDRKSIRGAKIPPMVAGSNEFVAESSANTQARFYSVQLGTGQENLKFIVEWVYRGFLRSIGLRGDPIFTTKRVNAVERVEESRAFELMMRALMIATKAGIPLPTAIKMYQTETGTTLEGEIIQEIQEAWTQRMDEKTAVTLTEPDDAEPET